MDQWVGVFGDNWKTPSVQFSNWRLQISFEDSKFAPSMSVCAMWWIGVLISLNWLYNQMDIKQKSECLSVHSKKVLGSTPKLDWKCFCKEFSRSIRSQKCCLSTNWACLLERSMRQSWQWSWESLVVIDGHFSRSIGANWEQGELGSNGGPTCQVNEGSARLKYQITCEGAPLSSSH